MQKITYPSSDQKRQVMATFWYPEGKPRAVLQLIHGMAEYIDRYAPFAEFMTQQGFVVAGNDHLGHGGSVQDASEYGYISETNPDQVLVDDVAILNRNLQILYPDVPLIILGHSMGSFVLRIFLQKYSRQVDAAIIMGTIGPQPAAKVALPYIRVMDYFKSKKRNPFFNFLMFSPYLKDFQDDDVDSIFRWVSKNPENVYAYQNDPLCGFCFTNNGFRTLLTLVNKSSSKNWLKGIRDDLPLLFITGESDPLTALDNGVQKIQKQMRKGSIKDVTFLSYPGLRHELLMEENKEMIYGDLLYWMEKKLEKIRTKETRETH